MLIMVDKCRGIPCGCPKNVSQHIGDRAPTRGAPTNTSIITKVLETKRSVDQAEYFGVIDSTFKSFRCYTCTGSKQHYIATAVSF